jgi:hypothetical protein
LTEWGKWHTTVAEGLPHTYWDRDVLDEGAVFSPSHNHSVLIFSCPGNVDSGSNKNGFSAGSESFQCWFRTAHMAKAGMPNFSIGSRVVFGLIALAVIISLLRFFGIF